MRSHNREFGFGQIVFRQFADIVEQFRAARVIEKLRGQRFLRLAETFHYLGERIRDRKILLGKGCCL